MNEQELKNIVEGALLAAGRSLSLDALQELFLEDGRPDKGLLRKVLDALREDFSERSIEIKETSSGFRIQVKQDYSEWVSRLWEERPTRYSRALLETLALVAYRQPITRGEIEEVRGVSVSTSIMRTLQDRDWVRIVGHRDVPGRPAMYGTTKTFLDYFNLKSLDELPTLSELRDIDSINVELDLREKSGDEERTAALKGPGESGDRELEGDDEEQLGVEVAMGDESEEATVEETAGDVDTDGEDDMNKHAGAGDASQEEGFERQGEEGPGAEDTGAPGGADGDSRQEDQGELEEDDDR